MNILLANIGNRNIKFGNQHVGKQNYFEETKQIYENFDDFKDSIELEILPSIYNNFQIDKAYFFVTNQPKPFRQDSYRVGKIIQKYWSDKNIELIEISHDPRKRDLSFEFIENFFKNHKFSKDEILINGSGGVPAMKEALNFYGVFDINAKIIDVDEETNEIMVSNVDKNYIKNSKKKILISMLQNFDYVGAKIFSKDIDINVSKACEYLICRFHFDFEQAKKFSSQFEFISKVKLQDFLQDSENIEYKNLMIKELLDNILISYEKGDYASCIAKIYALEDNLYKYCFEKITGIDVQDIEKIKSLGINTQQISNNGNVKEIVKSFELMNYLKNNYSNSDEIVNIIGEIGSLLYKNKEIRNNSIIAHGFGGISKNECEKNIIILKKFREKMYENDEIFFHQANKKLIEYIKNI